MSATAKTKWRLEADYLQACNCDYGCPCAFSAPPTLGYCDGMGAWRINRGHFGDVKLDGLGFAFAARVFSDFFRAVLQFQPHTSPAFGLTAVRDDP